MELVGSAASSQAVTTVMFVFLTCPGFMQREVLEDVTISTPDTIDSQDDTPQKGRQHHRLVAIDARSFHRSRQTQMRMMATTSVATDSTTALRLLPSR